MLGKLSWGKYLTLMKILVVNVRTRLLGTSALDPTRSISGYKIRIHVKMIWIQNTFWNTGKSKINNVLNNKFEKRLSFFFLNENSTHLFEQEMKTTFYDIF